MLTISPIGESGLAKPLDPDLIEQFPIEMVRTLDAFQKVVAVRSMVYMAEQDCPYEEEFDGNDLCASHVIAYSKGQPIATLRLRWFAGFGKIERVSILPAFRGSGVVKVMLAASLEIASRKGYRRMLAQIQARLWPLWSKTLNCRLMEDHPNFYFSDYEYCEMEISVSAHPDAIRLNSDPMTIIRPEGDWDTPGILEQSAQRGGAVREVAA
ncbi:MAG: GNAT family N-acetyltransferase [Henriciella sp.]|nr:GNAT family N-acetyltransferase [Henriciella sp.]